jgi:thiamine biosynthesis lipoprotein
MDATLCRHRFRAMGTDVELLVEADYAAHALAAAEEEFHRLEALLTRFRPESELSRLNAAGSLAAGPDLLRVVELALAAHERTDGRFDITVHDALLAAGYDRSFELLSPDDARAAGPAPGARGRVEIAAGVISLHGGARIDLGGIGKGYACERAAEILATAGHAS